MLNIAVLVSGGGTNLQALLDAQAAGTLKSGRITLVVSSKEGAYALTRAQNAGRRRPHTAQRFQRRLGVPLLHDTDDSIDDYDHENDRRLGPLP